MASGSYDSIIKQHYDAVADEFGASPQSTMADETVRAKETRVITDLVSAVAQEHGGAPLTVVDVGCGNGYSLAALRAALASHSYLGIEQNEKLRSIAARHAKVIPGDIRDLSSISLARSSADVVICQRALINILDAHDQRSALSNIVELAKPGGALLFIEVFSSGLGNLNAARAELGFPAIPPAVHNLPLPDDFFTHPELSPLSIAGFDHGENEFSTHYFVARVLHEVAIKASGEGAARARNSHFVKFLSAALPDGVGDYSPLRIKAFQKS